MIVTASTHSARRAWVLSDGAAGNENQARALAERLAARIETFRLETRPPWRWLAPRRLPGSMSAFGSQFAARLHAPWPDLAIGCGRQAALATRLLREASAGACRTVQILDPRIGLHHFDLVVAPRHDRLHGENLIATLGGLNPVDDPWLAQARTRFATLQALPAPRVALLLGGPTRGFALDRDDWERLVASLTRLLAGQGSLMVSSSRRTPAWLRDAARGAFGTVPNRQWHGAEDGENPYPGFLAWADAIVVSPDSVNMLSEAAATRVPVYTFDAHRVRGKVGDFVRGLCDAGRLQELGETLDSTRIEPLRETDRVATLVASRFGWAVDDGPV